MAQPVPVSPGALLPGTGKRDEIPAWFFCDPVFRMRILGGWGGVEKLSWGCRAAMPGQPWARVVPCGAMLCHSLPCRSLPCRSLPCHSLSQLPVVSPPESPSAHIPAFFPQFGHPTPGQSRSRPSPGHTSAGTVWGGAVTVPCTAPDSQLLLTDTGPLRLNPAFRAGGFGLFLTSQQDQLPLSLHWRLQSPDLAASTAWWL